MDRARCASATGRIEAPGLFRLSQQCKAPEQSLQADGISVEPGFQAVTLIASVPLSDALWQPFAEGEVVAVAAGSVSAALA